jgi:hypothetical protein
MQISRPWRNINSGGSLEVHMKTMKNICCPIPQQIRLSTTPVTRSEVVLANVSPISSNHVSESVTERSEILATGISHRLSVRRESCPSVVSASPHEQIVVPALSPPRRVVSMSRIDLHDKALSSNESCRLTVAERRERLKMSLSRLSNSVASVAESLNNAKKDASVKYHEPELSDILSSVSSIEKAPEEVPSPPPASLKLGANTSTLRVMQKPPSPSSGSLTQLGSGRPPQPPPRNPSTLQFAPSEIGKQLMAIYSTDKPQEPMWTTFVLRAKGPIEFADCASRMPAVVFCLRGLIRFGNGEYGSSRTDALPHLLNILMRRHPLAETGASLESAECSAAVLAMLAINPVSRQMSVLQHRPKFESVLTAQNGFLLQQLIGFLNMPFPRYLEAETQKDPNAPLTTRAVSNVLDIVWIYSATPILRSSWFADAPSNYKQSVLLTLTNLGERLPSVLNKTVSILDTLLDHMDADPPTCKQIANTIKSSVPRTPSPQIATETMQTLRRWGQPSSLRRTSSKSTFRNFLRTLGGSRNRTPSQTVSIKSTIYAEFCRT